MLGYVFLLDHFPMIIQPTGESNFSEIMHSRKPNFTKEYKDCRGFPLLNPSYSGNNGFGIMLFEMTGIWKIIFITCTSIRSNTTM